MSIGYAAGDASGGPDGGDGDGNHHDDPPYIVFGYGSLIFRVRSSSICHYCTLPTGLVLGYVSWHGRWLTKTTTTTNSLHLMSLKTVRVSAISFTLSHFLTRIVPTP